MIIAITYANEIYKKAEKFNACTAIHKGKADKVVAYTPKDIDRQFKKKNADILSQKRGNGYWLWKPYFILKTLKEMKDNDYLVYLDAGAFYLNDVRHLVSRMESDQQFMMSFELPFKERLYTKRDAFVYMGCDTKEYSETNQRMATMVVFKKTADALRFAGEWLEFGQEEGIITDAKNRFGKNNYAGFIEHRHDQSIFSLLSKKYGTKAYRDPSQYGRFPDLFWKTADLEGEECRYPQIIAAHKFPKVTKGIFREQMFFAYAPKGAVKAYLSSGFLAVQNKGKEKIAVLTDNMPIREDKYGFGMYKVVDRLLKAMGHDLDTVIITDQDYRENKADAGVRGKTVPVSRFHNVSNAFLSDLCFVFEVSGVMHKLRKKHIRKVFIPLGADYRELKRAYLVASLFRMAVSIYVVDDFIEYQEKIAGNGSNAGLEKKIVRYMKAADRVFVISEGMRERLAGLAGIRPAVLPLPWLPGDFTAAGGKRKPQVMFLGSANEMYLQGIRDVAEVIEKINDEKGMGIKFYFTYRSVQEVKRLVGNYRCIASGRIESEEELQAEIAQSICCVMPYSDCARYRILQETSFPSKLVEYMSAAPFIIVYGNDGNSAKRYFEDNRLPMVIPGRDKRLLEECIISQIGEERNYSENYRRVLRKKHSLEKVGKKLSEWYM